MINSRSQPITQDIHLHVLINTLKIMTSRKHRQAHWQQNSIIYKAFKHIVQTDAWRATCRCTKSRPGKGLSFRTFVFEQLCCDMYSYGVSFSYISGTFIHKCNKYKCKWFTQSLLLKETGMPTCQRVHLSLVAPEQAPELLGTLMIYFSHLFSNK